MRKLKNSLFIGISSSGKSENVVSALNYATNLGSNSFQIIQGLETLSLRIKQHCKNAIKVKEFLETSDKIEKVIFSTNQNTFFKENANKYLTKGKVH